MDFEHDESGTMRRLLVKTSVEQFVYSMPFNTRTSNYLFKTTTHFHICAFVQLFDVTYTFISKTAVSCLQNEKEKDETWPIGFPVAFAFAYISLV